MDFAIVGGDARFAYLTRLLCSGGRDARAVDGMAGSVPNVPWADASELSSAKNVVMNWPIPGGETLLERLLPGTRVFFCGPGAPAEVPDGISYIDLWKDERLLVDNAWLTAEGALSAAMNACDASLHDCQCLVIGWGRIGRALTEMLIGMNARATVASRSQRGRNCAIARGAEAVELEALADALPGKRIVFSTPPAPVLGADLLERTDEDVLIIDVASAPYGVDLAAAERLGRRAWLEPKLPGRYCPYSAALALLKAIVRAEGEHFHE